jgi:hypothetical protein
MMLRGLVDNDEKHTRLGVLGHRHDLRHVVR